jgi:hypothetical protein
MPMAKRYFTGSIVLVPADDRIWVAARVLYSSRRYRNVILMGLTTTVTRSPTLPAIVSRNYLYLVYTASQIIMEGRWLDVGTDKVLPEEEALALRIVGARFGLLTTRSVPQTRTTGRAFRRWTSLVPRSSRSELERFWIKLRCLGNRTRRTAPPN